MISGGVYIYHTASMLRGRDLVTTCNSAYHGAPLNAKPRTKQADFPVA